VEVDAAVHTPMSPRSRPRAEGPLGLGSKPSVPAAPSFTPYKALFGATWFLVPRSYGDVNCLSGGISSSGGLAKRNPPLTLVGVIRCAIAPYALTPRVITVSLRFAPMKGLYSSKERFRAAKEH
jgi:hypothetical protein